MPNWVRNTIEISGPEPKLKNLMEKLTEPKPVDANGKMSERGFSFWNSTSPTDLEAYFTTSGFSADKTVMETYNNGPSNWYSWNSTNWGTKWDACDASVELTDNELRIDFDTAWSSPTPIMEWFIKHVVATGMEMTYGYQEEQGWGGTVQVAKDGRMHENVWDIPCSHAEWEAIGEICPCEWDAETYDDCPKEEATM